MAPVFLPDLRLNAQISGPLDGPALVLIHALGLNMSIWDDLVQLLPDHRILRFDLRGHGASDCPEPPYTMGSLIRDTERLIDHFALRDCVVLGLSIGGLVAQGLAVKRLDQVRALILSNTAAKIGHPGHWQARIEMVRQDGMAALADATMQRWLGRNWQSAPAMPQLRAAFLATKAAGWIGAASALSGTDFYETTATLRLPLLAIAGGNDGATPADLLRETADLVPGSRFAVLPRAGHIPPVEAPEEYAALIAAFLRQIGHI